MAQKYIIGDLIKYKVGGLEFIAEITNTSKYGYCFKGVSDDISGTLCKEFANDIPLTPEILEKNGWKKDGKWYKLATKRAYLYITKDTKVNDEFLVCVALDMHNLASVSFVHELQHLLYGLKINSEMEV